MKVLVTGAKGQLGHDCCIELANRGIDCIGVDISDFDITSKEDTLCYVNNVKPDCIIHCAAYTAVDKAEDEAELCHRINVVGTENIALACKAVGAVLVYISTDYVFNGKGLNPFESDDSPEPLSVYGKTKLDGEKAVMSILPKHFIVRISWVFGMNGNNFIKTMLRLSQTKSEISVVDDQVGSPTYTKDLSVLLADIIQTDKYGIYHATNEGFCSWADLAEFIFMTVGKKINVKRISTEEYPTKAVRPKNSRLSKTSLDLSGLERLPSWQDAVKRFLFELQE